MKKKTTEIAVNTSSGAEKVEKIEKKVVKKSAPKKETSAKGEAALGGKAAERIKKVNAESSNGKAEQESKEAKARVEKALKRKEEQQKRREERKAKALKRKEEKRLAREKKLAEKKAKIEKRKAEKKAKAEKHAAERKALAEKRAQEKEAKLRERAHAKANRNNANYKKKKQKSERKAKKRERGERSKGYGGWIAAVVSLGVVSLALATTVTVGAIEMNKTTDMLSGAYRGTMYELTGIMENVDKDLDRVRISNSPEQQSRILTDLLVQTRLAELDLEKLPMAAEQDRNATSFINRTARECERMLTKLRKGETLSKEDGEILEGLYQTNHAVRMELDKMIESASEKDWSAYCKNGACSIRDAFDRIEKSTIEENLDKFGGKLKEMAGMNGITPPEKGEVPHVEASYAEELCLQYFTGYNIAEFQCVGETVAKGYEAYNVQGYDDKGNQLFAEISQRDGALMRFDYYEDCAGNTFDLERAEDIAEEFLEALGYDDMEAVRLRSNGSTTDFTFVYEEDGVAYYPDEIHVKVCRTRGVVSGFDATKYMMNHRARKEMPVKLSLGTAQSKLREGLQVEASRLTVVRTASGERTAYEFLCGYGEDKYFVFIDATTGAEISIVNIKDVL